jgi:hypothetical protein
LATSDADFANLFKKHGPHKLSRMLQVNVRSIYRRRDGIEQRANIKIAAPDDLRNTRHGEDHAARLHFNIQNGVALVGSDAHIWPGQNPTAFRAFVKFCRDMKPALAVMNGDVTDLPQVSRHPPIGWTELPTVADEIEEAQVRLREIELAVPRSCKLVFTLGNHDARFEIRLATVAPQYGNLHGFALKDHFPAWAPCWAAWINQSVVIKHRFKGGDHAPHNNTARSGLTMITGHLHSAKVTPYTDYTGTRYGVDTGCLADPDAKAFVDYTEDGPKNWRAGFCVLTFRNGRLMQPELCLVVDANHVEFRGEIINVGGKQCTSQSQPASRSAGTSRRTARRRGTTQSRANPTTGRSAPASAKTSRRRR